MRLAVISDIHGNLVSLSTVLRDLESSPVDNILFLGDAVAFGPQPGEVMAMLKKQKANFIMGNTDAMVLNPPIETEFKNKKAQTHYERIHWCREQLTPGDLDFLASFKPTLEILLAEGLTLTAYHGSTLSNEESIFADTPAEYLDRILVGQRASLFAGGHTHIQMLRRYQDRVFINPGSIGKPIIHMADHDYFPPIAEYAIIDAGAHGYSIDLRRVQVDVQEMIIAARNSRLPDVEGWINDWQIL